VKLILVRHGESVGNQENRLQGHNDYDLTDLGRVQAELTAERLRDLDVRHIYTSPLLRAYTTAETIAAVLGCPAVSLAELREYDFGELAGETYADLRQRFGGPALGPDGRPVERVYPGEEGRDVFFRRVTDAFWAIVDRHPGENVAIVSHGGPIALLCQTVLGLPYKRPMPFGVDNCSLSTVRVREEVAEQGQPRAVLAGLNDVCHLRRANAVK
jgi:broad specificity phosphatase PhoE